MTASEFVSRFEAAVRDDAELAIVLPVIAAVRNGASDQTIAQTADRLALAYASARRVRFVAEEGA